MDKNKQFYVKWTLGVCAFVSWIVLLYLKQTEGYSLRVPAIISILLSLGFISVFFWKQIILFLQSANEPKSKQISDEEVNEIIKKELEKRWVWREHGSFYEEEDRDVNENVIRKVEVKLHKEIVIDKELTNHCLFLINLNHPERRSIIGYTNDEGIIEAKMNVLSRKPEPKSDKRKVTNIGQFGQQTILEEEIHHKTEEVKEEEAVA